MNTISNQRRLFSAILIASLLGAGCVRSSAGPVSPTGAAFPSPVIQTAPAEAPKAFAWEEIADGIERGEQTIPQGEWNARIIAYRFDPSQYQFRFANVESAQSIRAWRDALPSAAFIINGVYFHEDDTPSGSLRIDGTDIGSRAFDADKSGLIVFDDTSVRILDTANEPLSGDEPNAAQSYPFLIKNNEPAVKKDSGLVARRSFIGTDADGHVILGVFTDGEISLHKLSRLLSDLPVVWQNVLNLDGGQSTSFVSTIPDHEEIEDGYGAIPNVIVVENF